VIIVLPFRPRGEFLRLEKTTPINWASRLEVMFTTQLRQGLDWVLRKKVPMIDKLAQNRYKSMF
jgi:hypothetical protein